MEKTDKLSFFTKIFQNKKNCRRHQCKWTLSDHSKGWSPPSFTQDNVRLVVIVQSQSSMGPGGRVLFDSKSELLNATIKQDGKKSHGCKSHSSKSSRVPCASSRGHLLEDTTTNCCREKRSRLASDIKVLEEMMFGSAPLIQKGSSLKVHTTRNPPQLMVTKLFLPTGASKESIGEHESFDLYSVQSTSAESTPRQISGSDRSEKHYFQLAQSVPVDVPALRQNSEDNDDSGFSASVASSCSSSFTTSGYSPSSSASMNSVNSLTRRLLRNKATSLEYSINMRLSDDSGEPRKRPARLGIGITFSLHEEDTDSFRLFESFFFSHITLIESHVVKLKVTVEKAILKSNKHMVIDALDVFRRSVYDLYTAPRLSKPVWLNMMCYSTHRLSLCQEFLKEFIYVIDRFDTKNTKFFVSTLVTAVLTHHLAWVPTVTPAGATPSRTYLDKHSAKWLDAFAKSHPYNPLWAQLGDLYGAIGFPLRLSRTVVTGVKADVVCKLLHVLSYFIRCSEIQENTEHRENLDFIDGHMDIPGKNMRTIEEHTCSISQTEESLSYDKQCGSVTSFGTIRHGSMQTSIETVASAKSNETVIERSPSKYGQLYGDSDQEFGQKSSLDPNTCTDMPYTVCAGYSHQDSTDVSECHCEDDSSDIDNLTEDQEGFCSKCRAVRYNCDTIHRNTTEWQYGNSVFYCCQDVIKNVGKTEGTNRICRCNFDLNLQSIDINECDERKDFCESKDLLDCTLGNAVPTEHVTSNVTDSNINETVSVKALKLFRMVSKEPVDEVTGELNICDTSFCDKPQDTTYLFKNSANKQELSAGNKLHSVSLIKALEPKDVFILHAHDASSTTTITTPSTHTKEVESNKNCHLESVGGVTDLQNSIEDNNSDTKCTLSPDCGAGKKVCIARTRHVGNVIPQEPKDVTFSYVDDFVCFTKLEPVENSIAVNKEIRQPNANTSDVLENIESSFGNTQISPAALTYSSFDTTTSQPTPCTVTSNVAKPLYPCLGTTVKDLYPCLGTTVKDPGITQTITDTRNQLIPIDSPHIPVHLAALNRPSPSEQEQLLLRDDPGCVKLIKKDLGTLYPVISGNTVISSLSTDRQSSDASFLSPFIGTSTSSLEQALDALRPEDDDVFTLEPNRPDVTGQIPPHSDSDVVLEPNDHTCKEPDIALVCSTCTEDEGSQHLTCSTCSDKTTVSVINSSVARTDIITKTESKVSPTQDKVRAWLGSQAVVHDAKTGNNEIPTKTVQEVTSGNDKEKDHSNEEPAACVMTDSKYTGEEPKVPKADVVLLLGKETCHSEPVSKFSKPVSKFKSFKRSDSMFEEYFDESVQLPDISEIEKKSSFAACQKPLLHDSDAVLSIQKGTQSLSTLPSATFDSVQTIDKENIGPCISSDGSLSMLDEYFTEDAETVSLPEGSSKDMVTTAISLIQEAQNTLDTDELLMDIMLESQGYEESRSRSNSESSMSKSKGRSYDRQYSTGTLISQQSLQAGTPARCRSVTPTELGRRRHLSTASSISWEVEGAEAKYRELKEVPMPKTVTEESSAASNSFDRNFGHSLLAGYTDHYMSDFVLHGTSDVNFFTELHTDLNIALQNSVLDEPITQACGIVADTDKWTVRLHSCEHATSDRMKPPMELTTSHLVCNILESVQKLWKLKMSPEFCLMHLEDRLQEIYFKSKMLAEYIRVHRKIDQKELTTMLGLDVSDLPLLLAVAGTHSSSLALAFAN